MCQLLKSRAPPPHSYNEMATMGSRLQLPPVTSALGIPPPAVPWSGHDQEVFLVAFRASVFSAIPLTVSNSACCFSLLSAFEQTTRLETGGCGVNGSGSACQSSVKPPTQSLILLTCVVVVFFLMPGWFFSAPPVFWCCCVDAWSRSRGRLCLPGMDTNHLYTKEQFLSLKDWKRTWRANALRLPKMSLARKPNFYLSVLETITTFPKCETILFASRGYSLALALLFAWIFGIETSLKE